MNPSWIRKIPPVTFLCVFLCLFAYLFFRHDLSELWRTFAFVAGVWHPQNLFRLFSSFFVHAGVAPLLGNLYFLYVFSNDVESSSSARNLFLILFGGQCAGMLMQSLVVPQGTLIGGANAGIYAVMIYAFFRFPKARLTLFMIAKIGLDLLLMNAAQVVSEKTSYVALVGGSAFGGLMALMKMAKKKDNAS